MMMLDGDTIVLVGAVSLTASLVLFFVWRFLAILSANRALVHAESGKTLPGPSPSFPYDFSWDRQSLESEEFERAYGSTYRLWCGVNPVVVTSSPDAARMLFRAEGRSNRDFGSEMGFVYDWVLGLMLGGSGTESWQGSWNRLHKVFAPHYRQICVNREWDDLCGIVKRFVGRVIRDAAASTTTNEGERRSFDLSSELPFESLVIEQLAGIAFGAERVDTRDVDFLVETYRTHTHRLLRYARSPWTRILRWPLVAVHSLLTRLGGPLGSAALFALGDFLAPPLGTVMKDFDRLVRDKRALALKNPTSNRAAAPVIETSLERLSFEELKHTLYEVTIFNVDITAAELAQTFLILAERSDVQQKLHDEIDRAVEASGGASVVPIATVQKMEYLDAILCEISRLFPAIRLTFPEMIGDTCTLDGFVVPRGTRVAVDVQSCQRRTTEWGDDAAEFRPERWFVARSERGFLYRFGMGVRRCLGHKFALAMIKSSLIEVLRNHRVVLKARATSTDVVTVPMYSPVKIAGTLSFVPR